MLAEYENIHRVRKNSRSELNSFIKRIEDEKVERESKCKSHCNSSLEKPMSSVSALFLVHIPAFFAGFYLGGSLTASFIDDNFIYALGGVFLGLIFVWFTTMYRVIVNTERKFYEDR